MKISYSEVRRRCLKADEAVKPIYARFITHWFSTRLVWLLQDLPLTPNFLTLLSLVFGFAAIPFFAAFTPASILIGCLLVETYYIFDAVDGQWARLKNMKSLTGAFFDCSGNYLIQPCSLFFLGLGLARQTLDLTACALGFCAALSTLWLIVMWNVRQGVILDYLTAKQRPPRAAQPSADLSVKKRSSHPKNLFSWLHKSMVFPWMMNVLTLGALGAGLTKDPAPVFSLILFYYGIGGPVIAVLITGQWVLTRKIDASAEISV